MVIFVLIRALLIVQALRCLGYPVRKTGVPAVMRVSFPGSSDRGKNVLHPLPETSKQFPYSSR